MIDVRIIASGSKGNCYALRMCDKIILLDAGIPFKNLQLALEFKNPDAVLITHEHGDHANPSTLHELLNRGVNVFMTQGTIDALKLVNRHNLNVVKANGVPFKVSNEVSAQAYRIVHDAAEPVAFGLWTGKDDETLYITDNGADVAKIPYGTRYLLIEANYSEAALANSAIDDAQKRRIARSHFSIEQVVKCLEASDLKFLREIYLIHLSKRHGDGILFINRVRAAVPEYIKIYATGDG